MLQWYQWIRADSRPLGSDPAAQLIKDNIRLAFPQWTGENQEGEQIVDIHTYADLQLRWALMEITGEGKHLESAPGVMRLDSDEVSFHPATESLVNVLLRIQENSASLAANTERQNDFMSEVAREIAEDLIRYEDYKLGFNEFFKLAVMVDAVPGILMRRDQFAKIFSAIISAHVAKGVPGKSWMLFPIYYTESGEIPEVMKRDAYGRRFALARLLNLQREIDGMNAEYWKFRREQSQGRIDARRVAYRRWIIERLDELQLLLDASFAPMLQEIER